MNVTGVKGLAKVEKATLKAPEVLKMEEVIQSAIRITTGVLPNGKVELQLPPESAGDDVEVFIVLPEKSTVPDLSTMDIINQPREHQKLFKTSEEMDQYLRTERDSWEH